MQGQPSGLLFNIIKPLSKKATIDFINLKNNLSIKNSPAIKDDFKKDNVISSFHENESCQSRTMMFIRGIRYLYFYHCYPLEAIENDISCPGRMVPFFLDGDQTQCLFSVSYNWGGFDSVETYSEKIERMKAGNVNTASFPLLNCTTGVDCSGFISNLWGLKTKWGTSQIFANTSSVDISQMKVGDVFVKPNSHVIMYTGNLNDNISTMESVVRPGKVISSEDPIKWFIQHGYTPKLAYNACEDDYS